MTDGGLFAPDERDRVYAMVIRGRLLRARGEELRVGGRLLRGRAEELRAALSWQTARARRLQRILLASGVLEPARRVRRRKRIHRRHASLHLVRH